MNIEDSVPRGRAGFTRHSDLLLALAVVAVLALMVLPMNAVLIDALVAVNICCGVGLLLVAIYISTPVAFSSFPSVLLIYTLFRLSLSIATTRLILVEADGGHVIQTFGELVAGGSLVVGLVVFCIITIVQFIVVAKGAERVAEVAARFSLDAMPGKQLSIDSDLRAGLIDKDEAKRRRKLLEVESQLHGSLDGAMKFVKGDAIAGIIIIGINLVGGIAVGVFRDGMDIGVAVRTFCILTIGDGLVTQIPALLGAISAGLIVTRTVGDEADRHLGESISKQVLSQHRVLLVTGCISLLLAAVPGFPTVIFLLLGVLLLVAGAALAGMRLKKLRSQVAAAFGAQTTPKVLEDDEELRASPVRIIVAANILSTFSPRGLHEIAARVASFLSDEKGLPGLDVKIAAVSRLNPDRFEVRIHGVPAYSGSLPIEHHLVVSISGARPHSETSASPLTQSSEIYPGLPVRWIASSQLPALPPDSKVLPRDEALFWIAKAVVERNVGLLLGVQEANAVINRLALDYPDLVKEVMRVIPLQKLADIMRRIVDEQLSLTHSRDLFEALVDAGQREKDVGTLCEYGRIGLRRHICHTFALSDQSLHVITLSPDVERMIAQSIRLNGTAQLVLEPNVAKSIVARLESAVQRLGPSSVLLVSIDIRRFVRKLIEHRLPRTPVLSHQELTADVRVFAKEVITMPNQASNVDAAMPLQPLAQTGLAEAMH